MEWDVSKYKNKGRSKGTRLMRLGMSFCDRKFVKEKADRHAMLTKRRENIEKSSSNQWYVDFSYVYNECTLPSICAAGVLT